MRAFATISSMLIYAPQSNSPNLNDALGAFQPEANAFARLHGGTVTLFRNALPLGDRRATFLRSLELQKPARPVFAAFCHGWRRGIQLGFTSGHVRLLARALVDKLPGSELVIALYCCDTGMDTDDDRRDDIAEDGIGGIGGFADLLCTAIAAQGKNCHIYAHASEGHTTFNPHVRVFSSTDAHPDGGAWLISPRDPMFRAWRNALRTTSLRFRFPFMTPDQIRAELRPLVA